MRTAQGLRGALACVTVIDRSNHHLFQPLLYQVATATLSPANIATPIRSILRKQQNAEVLMAEVTGIDPTRRLVFLGEKTLSYDYLVIATGATHGYFGHENWAKFAPGLKSIADATFIRQRILTAFEQAEMEADLEKRNSLLQFVLVGGGPTGVEMAGAIAELSHRALEADFRKIDPCSARVTLVEAGPRLLAAFPEDLSDKARRDLEKLGVTVLLSSRVDDVTAEGVWIGGKLLAAKTVLWAAGVVASPAGKWLNAEMDRAGRVKTLPDLALPGHPEIFVIGDTACVTGPDGKPLPGVAPVAMQQGNHVADLLKSRLEGKEDHSPFFYRDKGNLATIGRRSAVAAIGRWHLTGGVAWIAWLLVHIYYLIGFRTRLVVLIEWAWAYVFFQRGARLIVPRAFSLFW